MDKWKASIRKQLDEKRLERQNKLNKPPPPTLMSKMKGVKNEKQKKRIIEKHLDDIKKNRLKSEQKSQH